MHVGHLRSTIIGDCICRRSGVPRPHGHPPEPHRRLGHAVRDADRAYLSNRQAREIAARGLSERRLSEAERFPTWRTSTARPRRRIDATPNLPQTLAREYVVKLQIGRPETCDAGLWRVHRSDQSLAALPAGLYEQTRRQAYAEDDVRGESAYNDDLPTVVEDLQASRAGRRNRMARCACFRRGSRPRKASRCSVDRAEIRRGVSLRHDRPGGDCAIASNELQGRSDRLRDRRPAGAAFPDALHRGRDGRLGPAGRQDGGAGPRDVRHRARRGRQAFQDPLRRERQAQGPAR